METLFFFILLPFLYFLTNHLLRRLQNFPPCPLLSLPLIGHLYILKKPLHRTLARISNKYGPILFLQFGSRPVLLVSSPSAAEECLTKNDIIFANRPRLLAGKHLGYNYTSLVWASYGDHWRNLRRIASLEIFSTHRIQMFSDIRRSEVHLLVKRLIRDSEPGEYRTVDMKSAFFEMMLNIMMRMIAGKRYYDNDRDDSVNLGEAKKFKEIVTETFQLSGATNMGDFLPLLRWIGMDKTENRLKILQEKRHRFMQGLIDEHRRNNTDNTKKEKTLIDVLLSLQQSEPECYNDEIISGMMQVMLSAGTDTSVATMEWALSLLLNNPSTLMKAQKELDNYIGNTRLIEDVDFGQLPYLHGVINETLRMYPVSPLIPPHESSEECTVGGFRVPRGTMLLVNLWAIQNDPKLWDEPRDFKPERFINLVGQRDGFTLMPFGYGRRGCPGENLAMHVIGLVLGSLIQFFEWTRECNELVDMSEGAGLTMPKAKTLLAKCRPRRGMLKLLSQI